MAHEWVIEGQYDTCAKCGEVRKWDKERKSFTVTVASNSVVCLLPSRAIFSAENNPPKKGAAVSKLTSTVTPTASKPKNELYNLSSSQI